MREFLYHLKKNDIGDYIGLAGTIIIFALCCKAYDVFVVPIPV